VAALRLAAAALPPAAATAAGLPVLQRALLPPPAGYHGRGDHRAEARNDPSAATLQRAEFDVLPVPAPAAAVVAPPVLVHQRQRRVRSVAAALDADVWVWEPPSPFVSPFRVHGGGRRRVWQRNCRGGGGGGDTPAAPTDAAVPQIATLAHDRLPCLMAVCDGASAPAAAVLSIAALNAVAARAGAVAARGGWGDDADAGGGGGGATAYCTALLDRHRPEVRQLVGVPSRELGGGGGDSRVVATAMEGGRTWGAASTRAARLDGQ